MATTYSSGAYQDKNVVYIQIMKIFAIFYKFLQITIDLYDSCTDDHTGTSGWFIFLFIFELLFFPFQLQHH
jgi:hypothetical protein